MNKTSLAYTILALAPFTHEMVKPWENSAVLVESADFSAAMERLQPSLYLALPENLCPAGGFEINFRSMKDFTPDGLLLNQPFLADLFSAMEYLETAAIKKLAHEEIAAEFVKWSHLPAINLQPVQTKKSAKAESNPIDSILSMVALPDDSAAGTNKNNSGSTQLENIIKKILGILFQDAGFRSMEAAWRGLQLLFEQGKPAESIRVEIVPAVQDNLEETLDNLMSTLLVNPPALILVDSGFNSSSRSMELLADLAELGNTLLAPVVAWIKPEFLQIEKWIDIERLAYIPHHLDTPAFAKWKKLQLTPAGKWLALNCNRFLGRFPYGVDNLPRKLQFIETELPWVAPVWATACLFVQAVNHYGWPVGIDVYQQQRLDNLALDMGSAGKPKAVEVILSDEKVDQLSRAGIMPLRSLKDSVFVTNESMISRNITFSYQNLVSRFAQLVISARDLLTDDITGENIEDELFNKLNIFFARQGTVVGDDLKVIAGPPDKNKRIPVQVTWRPPLSLLSAGNDLRLDFLW